MRTVHACLALSTALFLGTSCSKTFAQGIGEYAGALGASSATSAGARKGMDAHAHAVQGLYNNPLGVLDKDKAAPNENTVFKTKYDLNGDPVEVDPRVTVNAVGKISGKLYADGVAKEKAGKLAEAEQLYMRSVKLRTRIWGDNDPAVQRMYMQIGNIEMKRKNPSIAEPFFKRALQANLKRYGVGSYELVPYLDALGRASLAELKYSDAENYFQQVQQMKDRKMGAGHEETIVAVNNLVRAYAADPDQSNLSTADELMKANIPHAEALTSQKHLMTALDLYGTVLKREGKTAEADQISTRLSDLKIKIGAPASPVSPAPAGPADATANKPAEKKSDVTAVPASTGDGAAPGAKETKPSEPVAKAPAEKPGSGETGSVK